MIDIQLCESGDYEGDLFLTEDGDIQLCDDVLQDAKIAVGWIEDEWRLGPDIGLPYFDEFFVKNPNIPMIRQEIRNAIMEIEGVSDATVEILEFDAAARKIRIAFQVTVGSTTESGEVSVGG